MGWIKRGPSGVIGTNKKDAQETVDALLADLAADTHLQPADPDPESIERLLAERVPALVTYEGWSEIDRHEQALGEPHGRPRVKLTRIEQLLEVAAGESPGAEPLDTLGLALRVGGVSVGVPCARTRARRHPREHSTAAPAERPIWHTGLLARR